MAKVPIRRGSPVTRRVDGAKLRSLRQQHGWSQEQLARHADLSERLIRKAESSALLRYTTLIRLANALSKGGLSVFPGDLTLAEIHKLSELVESLFIDCHDSSASEVKEYHAALRTFVAGNPSNIPFAGTYHGVTGFIGFRKALRESLNPYKRVRNTTEWFTADSRFCMCCDIQVAISEPGQTVTTWLVIRSPSTSELSIHFDTEAMAQAIQTRRQQR